TLGKRVVKALHDPTNTENIVIIGDGFWVTDTSGERHYITVKTADRVCRPMVHPSYPDLIELLGVKNPEVKMPECIPDSSGNPESIKDIYLNRMRRRLGDYIKQVKGGGFTQTHALRHLANHHGKLSGLTRDQRALSLGHSGDMNDKYDGHLTPEAEIDFLMSSISKESEIAELKAQLQHAQETILFLKKENARLREQLGGNDDIPRIGE
ncbi:hypothetical protein PMG71_07170, partial [Roseofilum sp. BLCC_M154]